jgi:hypothetical protein
MALKINVFQYINPETSDQTKVSCRGWRISDAESEVHILYIPLRSEHFYTSIK